MSAKPITKFFKRKAEEQSVEEEDAPAPAAAVTKAARLNEEKAGDESAGAGAAGAGAVGEGLGLSAEQQKQVDAKKEAALRKRALSSGLPESGLLGKSWLSALGKEIEKPYYKELMAFLAKEQAAKATVFPPADQVFTWASECPLSRTRVVIIGQDPYHGPGQAHGLCFSVQKGVAPPPSLVNIYKELETDVPGFRRPKHGCLDSWAEQGVLLLNAVLTVRRGEPNSHKDKGWEKFTDAVIETVNRTCRHVVFIEWGAYAQKKGGKIDKTKHCVLTGAHPSPLSQTKFFGCKHFSKTNAYLTSHGLAPINWSSVCEDQ